MICAPILRCGTGSQLLLAISVPKGQILKKLRLVYSTIFYSFDFAAFQLVRLVHSQPTEDALSTPFQDLKSPVNFDISEMGKKRELGMLMSNSCLRLVQAMMFSWNLSNLYWKCLLGNLGAGDCSFKVCFLVSKTSFFLNAVISASLESVLMMILPRSSFSVLKQTGSPQGSSSLRKKIFLKRYFKRMLDTLYLFSSLAWFQMDRMMGQWLGQVSKNLAMCLIVSQKSIGLQKEVSLTAWLMMGTSPSLWISISTHFNPLPRSSRYRSILQSLVSWLPLRQVLCEEQQKQSVRGRSSLISNYSAAWLSFQFYRNVQNSQKFISSFIVLPMSSAFSAVIFCSAMRKFTKFLFFMIFSRQSKCDPIFAFAYFSKTPMSAQLQ